MAKLMLLLRCSLGSTAMGRNEKVCAREVRRITGAVEKVHSTIVTQSWRPEECFRKLTDLELVVYHSSTLPSLFCNIN